MKWGGFVAIRYLLGGFGNNTRFGDDRLENKMGYFSETRNFGSNWGGFGFKGESWGNWNKKENNNWKGENWGSWNDDKDNGWGGKGW